MERITEKTISLIGAGSRRADLTAAAQDTAEHASVLIGSKRMLSLFADRDVRKLECTDPKEIAKWIADIEGKENEVCVLFSGDPGFYSGAERLSELLEENGIKTRWFPGISSAQAFAAKLKRSWHSLRLVSAHGVEADPVFEVMQNRDVLFLTNGPAGPREICRSLSAAGLSFLPVFVGENLGMETERIRSGTVESFCDYEALPMNVILVSQAPIWHGPKLGIPDEEFCRGNVPMTKQNIRPLIVSKLFPNRDEICWDIGSGTGSVSVELSFMSKQVYAVERDPAGVALIEDNKKKFSAWNIRIVSGEAPEICEALPAPDVIFIGGSGKRLREIISTAQKRNHKVRIGISSVTVETAAEAVRIFKECGWDYEVTQYAVSHTVRGDAASILHGENPVTLITAEKKENERKPSQ